MPAAGKDSPAGVGSLADATLTPMSATRAITVIDDESGERLLRAVFLGAGKPLETEEITQRIATVAQYLLGRVGGDFVVR
jgi:hypothetical protein